MSKFSAMIMLAALLALGGCGGGGTPDCGADETLDVAMDILVESIYMDAHKQKLGNDLRAARKEERRELFPATSLFERHRQIQIQRGNYGPPSFDASDDPEEYHAARKAAAAEKPALAEFDKETQAMLNEISGIEASSEEMQDEHNLQLEYVAMTAYNETTDTYQCSARVTSDHWEDEAITYMVQTSATDSDSFFVEVFRQ